MQLTKDELDALADQHRVPGHATMIDHRAFAAAVIAEHTAKVLEDVEPVAWLDTVIDWTATGQPITRRIYWTATGQPITRRICIQAQCGDWALSYIESALRETATTVAALKLQRDALQARVDAEPEGFTQGIDAAAKMLDKMADDYSRAHAIQDPDTGVYEFGRGAKEDYYNTLRELADDVRSIVYAPGERENAAQTLKAAKDAAFEQAANLVELEYAPDAKAGKRLAQIARHIRDLKKRSS